MKTVLCAPLEDIVGCLPPFVGDKKTRLTFIECRAKMAAEIVERSRAVEQNLHPRAVAARVTLANVFRQPGMPTTQLRQEPRKIRVRQVAARQARIFRPRTGHLWKVGRQLLQRVFGKPAICCDLAAEHREHWRRLSRRVQVEHVVARNRARIGSFIVIQRADAGKRMDHVARRGRVFEIGIDNREKILDLLRRDMDVLRSTIERDVRRADQSEVAFIRVDEDHALVVVLQQIALLALPELASDNMAASDQAHMILGVAGGAAQDVLDPWTSCVNENLATRVGRLAVARIFQFHGPRFAIAPRGDEGSPGKNPAATLANIESIENDESRVIHPAIRIFESALELLADRIALARGRKVKGSGRRKDLAPAKMIVKKQAS